MAATPACERMPTPTIDTLDEVRLGLDLLGGAHVAAVLDQQLARARQVARRQRERQVGAAVVDVGLDDDVDDDAGRRQRAEDLRRTPGSSEMPVQA